jgi:hypothetical protein
MPRLRPPNPPPAYLQTTTWPKSLAPLTAHPCARTGDPSSVAINGHTNHHPTDTLQEKPTSTPTSIPATNLTEPTAGWIETNRLYEVDSLMTPNPIKNPIEPPPVIPPPGAAVRSDILTWLAMQDRAWLLDSSLDDGESPSGRLVGQRLPYFGMKAGHFFDPRGVFDDLR